MFARCGFCKVWVCKIGVFSEVDFLAVLEKGSSVADIRLACFSRLVVSVMNIARVSNDAFLMMQRE